MTKILVEEPAFFRLAQYPPGNSASPESLLIRGLRAILHWRQVWRQRRALGELGAVNSHLLRDIGLTQEQALVEAAKPFWQC